MKKSNYLIALALGASTITFAQNVGINTDGSDPDANTLLHLNNHSASSLDSALLRIENEKATTGTGVQIENSGTASSKWDIIVPGSSTDLRIKGNGSDHVTIQNDGDVGVGTTSPVSGFDVQTSMGLSYTTITDNIVLNNTHNVVLCNDGPYTVNLPAANTCDGRVYYIKNIDTDGDDITIDGNGSETIDGDETFILDPYKHAVRIVSDGSNWHVLEESGTLTKDNSFTQINCDGSIFTWSDVTNGTTGDTWMDRNLGASQVATSSTDTDSYGDLYQWGRAKDGHQCRTSSTTSTNSADNVPSHGDFITNTSGTRDWRSSQNDLLWQGVDGTNNPCPSGYRIPTQQEWIDEYNSWPTQNADGAFNGILKIPYGGKRNSGGGFGYVGVAGVHYWSSTVSSTTSIYAYFTASSASTGSAFNYRSHGMSIRCIKD